MVISAPSTATAQQRLIPRASWRPSTLDRYLIFELAGPFCFGVAAFTTIMTASNVLFNLISLMVRLGLPLVIVFQVLALRLPEMIFYTFPMSMLLASLLALSRLADHSEIMAFRSVGVSLIRIVTPVLLVAALVSGLTICLNEFVVPTTKWQAKNMLYFAQNQRRLPAERHHVFYDEMEDGQLRRFFYARHFDGQSMEGVLVQEFENDSLARIIQAKTATWNGSAWHFHQGTLYQVAADGEYRYVLRFEEQLVKLKSSLLSLTAESREPMEMNLRDLSAHIKRLREAGHAASQILDLGVQWHQKLSIPFASLAFALVGAALGLRPHRSSGSWGLGLSVVIIFIYYLAMFFFMALGQTGSLAPVVAAWLPNLLAGLVGSALLWRISVH